MADTTIEILFKNRQFSKDSGVAIERLGAIGKAAGAAFAAISVAAGASIKLFSDFETGLVGVAKTTGISGAELQNLGKRFQEISTTIPVATNELLEIAQSAGQLGVTGAGNIEKFALTIAKLGRASDLQGEAAATQLTRILTVTGDGVETVDKFASVIVRLGNNFAATEGEIAAVATRVASTTATFNVGATNVAGISTALKALGQNAEIAGSVVGRGFNAIDQSIRKGGAGLEKLIELTGLSAEELKKTFAEDSTEVFRLFAEGLGKSTDAGASLSEELGAIGLKGVGVNQVFGALAKGSDVLTDALSQANDEAQNGTALNDEFAAAIDTTASKFKVFLNQLVVVGQEIGARLAPSFNVILDRLGKLFDAFRGSQAFDDFLLGIQGMAMALEEFLLSFDIEDVVAVFEFGLNVIGGTLAILTTAFLDIAGEIRAFINFLISIPDTVRETFEEVTTIISDAASFAAGIFGDEEKRPPPEAFGPDPQKVEENAQKVIEINKSAADTTRDIATDSNQEKIDTVVSQEEEFRARLLELNEEFKLLSKEQQDEFIAENLVQLEAIKAAETEIARKALEEETQLRLKENNLRLKEEAKFGADVANIKASFRSQEVQDAQKGLGDLTALQRTNSKELFAIGKAAAFAKATINVAGAIAEALPNPFLAASAAISGGVQLATIASTRFTGAQEGGLLEGGIPGKDSIPVLGEPGELVVPRQNFEEVVNAVAAQRSSLGTQPTPGGGDIAASGGGGISRVEIDVNFADDAIEIIESRIVNRQDNGTSILLNGEVA